MLWGTQCNIGVASAFLLALGLPGCGGKPQLFSFDGDPPRNILWLSIDTLRVDQVGRYSGGDATPNIDSLLSRSVVFDDSDSCSSWTLPSLSCVYSGRHMLQDGFWPALTPDGLYRGFPAGWRWGPTALQDAGFWTGLASGNGALRNLPETFLDGLDRQWFADDRGEGGVGASEVTDAAFAAADQLSAAEPDRWFLHVHYNDPHLPLTPPSSSVVGEESLTGIEWDFGSADGPSQLTSAWAALTEEERSQAWARYQVFYAGELRTVDQHLQRLLAGFDDRGLLDDTLVVLFSDHGEQFYEHGEIGHGKNLHFSERRILTAFWARGLASGSSDIPISGPDLLPTTLHLVQADSFPTLAPLVAGFTGKYVEDWPGDRTRLGFVNLKAASGNAIVSLRQGPGLLVYRWDGVATYHDVGADPREQTDRYDPASTEVQALWEAMKEPIGAAEQGQALEPPVPPPGLSF